MPPVDRALAAVLRRIREDRGLSQEAVARKADISVVTLARIEGSPDTPTKTSPAWATVSAIAAAMSLPLEELGRLVERQRQEEPEERR
jgi:transcriptional regulator with XRE-family HTH domain